MNSSIPRATSISLPFVRLSFSALWRATLVAGISLWGGGLSIGRLSAAPPNIVLVMADDQGWGQTGYYQHPVLKTPELDAMAAAGLRFDRFYAAAPVCSPTRASVLTGRSNQRTGVMSHGYALRRQERSLASALRSVARIDWVARMPRRLVLMRAGVQGAFCTAGFAGGSWCGYRSAALLK